MAKILVVDDDKDILEVVSLLLSIHGYTVGTIFSADETPDMIQSFKPDIILMDVNMGRHDGRNVCKQLKEMAGVKNIPVILFSAVPNLERIHSECGADDFLLKPFDVDDMISKIEKHLKGLNVTAC